ncbi:maker338 [Drosophila busckii]|uniref:Maker338 n=1 Tax=Drosophila busckii TaxID=30019 RepID=A0A0M4EVX3_DROBS|nr:uncharacterized protein LOC108607208 [Drosophila busckii]XP_017853363.1 uncharacterized protein LOC108607208 [Drosophila busckii]ALC49485.1 maker338 [Drosophila busckii]
MEQAEEQAEQSQEQQQQQQQEQQSVAETVEEQPFVVVDRKSFVMQLSREFRMSVRMDHSRNWPDDMWMVSSKLLDNGQEYASMEHTCELSADLVANLLDDVSNNVLDLDNVEDCSENVYIQFVLLNVVRILAPSLLPIILTRLRGNVNETPAEPAEPQVGLPELQVSDFSPVEITSDDDDDDEEQMPLAAAAPQPAVEQQQLELSDVSSSEEQQPSSDEQQPQLPPFRQTHHTAHELDELDRLFWSFPSSSDSNHDDEENWDTDRNDDESLDDYLLNNVAGARRHNLQRHRMPQPQQPDPAAWEMGSCGSSYDSDSDWSTVVDPDEWQHVEDRSFETALSLPFRRLIGEAPTWTAEEQRQITQSHKEPDNCVPPPWRPPRLPESSSLNRADSWSLAEQQSNSREQEREKRRNKRKSKSSKGKGKKKGSKKKDEKKAKGAKPEKEHEVVPLQNLVHETDRLIKRLLRELK